MYSNASSLVHASTNLLKLDDGLENLHTILPYDK